jgi:hypothetical protein
MYMCMCGVGIQVGVKGPFPKLPYSRNMKKELCMLAGGSGRPAIPVLPCPARFQ